MKVKETLKDFGGAETVCNGSTWYTTAFSCSTFVKFPSVTVWFSNLTMDLYAESATPFLTTLCATKVRAYAIITGFQPLTLVMFTSDGLAPGTKCAIVLLNAAIAFGSFSNTDADTFWRV